MKTRAALTTVFVLSRTIFLHLRISIATLLIVILFFITQSIVQKNKIRYKKIALSIGLFLAIIISFLAHISGFRLQQNNPGSLQPTFIGTGQIIDLQRDGKYTLQTPYGTYLLRSSTLLHLGDIIRTSGKITQPKHSVIQTKFTFSSLSVPAVLTGGFDYPQRLEIKGFQGDIQGSSTIVLEGPTKLSWIIGFRKAILKRVQLTFGINRSAGLFQGMLIGDRSGIPTDEYQQFISSGLVHIVAVSGSNILYVVLLFHAILFFIPYYIRIFIILFAIVLYALICGLDSSVIRAVIMGGLTLISLLGGRVVSARRLLYIAWVSMLIWNPRLFPFDLGFLLSFSALAGILLLSKYTENLPQKTFLNRLLKSYVIPSIGAGLGVLPVVIFFTGTTNLLSIIGNIFIVPLVSLVLGRGVVAVLIDSILSISKYIDIITFPFERLYWLARRLTDNGIFLSTSVWRTRHIFVGIVAVGGVLLGLLLDQTRSHKVYLEEKI